MIDSMGFIIPIDYSVYNDLTAKSLMTQRIDCKDGAIEFEYFNFDTSYSWNYRIKWKLDDRKYCYDPGLKKTFLEKGFPHLRMEYSAPKILLGNNINTVTEVFSEQSTHIVKAEFEKSFKVVLPPVSTWYLTRLDVCSNFILPSEFMVKELIDYFQMLSYPRKKKQIFDSECIYCPSKHSTLKIYAKGPEFKAHDLKRFKNQIEGRQLLKQASKIIRIEAELKDRLRYLITEFLKMCVPLKRLKYRLWNGFLPYYETMKLINCKGELERMINNFMITKESKVMKAKEVHDKLRQKFSLEQADVFMGIYSVILTQGLKNARKIYTSAKMGRALQAYRFLGISFINSDASVIDAGLNIPYDFSFEMSEKNKYYQLPLAA